MIKHDTPYTKHQTLSVVLATRNEEANIGACLASVNKIASEIIVVDEESVDKTQEIAKKYGAKVYKVKHEPIFHKTKQKAMDKASGDWILQLDADERVTPGLADEIKEVVTSKNVDLKRKILSPNTEHQTPNTKKAKLFLRHQKLIEQRDGSIGKINGEVAGFFIPRVNYFLGKPLVHAGVYPDASIRLVKRGRAHFPAKSVHEQMQVDGEIGWLFNNLEHHDSPTLKRYLERMNRYTDLHAQELKNRKITKNPLFFIRYSLFKPLYVFFSLYLRHKGFLDGIRGFLWSFFSAMHFPMAYYKYLTNE